MLAYTFCKTRQRQIHDNLGLEILDLHDDDNWQLLRSCAVRQFWAIRVPPPVLASPGGPTCLAWRWVSPLLGRRAPPGWGSLWTNPKQEGASARVDFTWWADVPRLARSLELGLWNLFESRLMGAALGGPTHPALR